MKVELIGGPWDGWDMDVESSFPYDIVVLPPNPENDDDDYALTIITDYDHTKNLNVLHYVADGADRLLMDMCPGSTIDYAIHYIWCRPLRNSPIVLEN